MSALSDVMTGLTYGQFLALFLLPPIAGLAILVLRDHWRPDSGEKSIEKHAGGASHWWLLAGLIAVAIVYTIPWDSHMIAEGVWSFAPSRVTGIAIAGIPLEELLFFPLQTLLIGLWVFWLTPRLTPERAERRAVPSLARWVAVGVAGVAWLVGLVILLRGWWSGTYLGWELAWALPPLALQLGLGGDALWRRRRLVLAAWAPVVMYLCAADALAIHAGIWRIAASHSLGALIGGVMPVEECVFFLLTGALVTGGLIVGMAPEVRERLHLRPGHVGA
jgi:putative membrane protein